MPLDVNKLDFSSLDDAAQQLRSLRVQEVSQAITVFRRRFGFSPQPNWGAALAREEAFDLLLRLDPINATPPNSPRNRVFSGSFDVAAGVGNVSQALIFNPASSPKNILLLSATGSLSVAGEISFTLLTVDPALGNPFTSTKLNLFDTGLSASFVSRETSNSTAAPAGNLFDNALVAVNTPYSLFNLAGSNCPLILLTPGFGFAMWSSAVNTRLAGHMRWAEISPTYG